jgi:hypothetical protein
MSSRPWCNTPRRASELLGAPSDSQLDDEVESDRHGNEDRKQNRQLCRIDPKHDIKVAAPPPGRVWTEHWALLPTAWA